MQLQYVSEEENTLSDYSGEQYEEEEDDDEDVMKLAPYDQTDLQFTVVYGAQNGDPPCYLLEVSGYKILLDCGWNDSYDISIIEPLRLVAKDVNLVLITHANLEHMGALPYAYKYFGLKAPVYLTEPVKRLGQLALYDAVLSCFPSQDINNFLSRAKKRNAKKLDGSSQSQQQQQQQQIQTQNQTQQQQQQQLLMNQKKDNDGVIAVSNEKQYEDDIDMIEADEYNPRCGYDLDDIDYCVEYWTELKYSQSIHPTGAKKGIMVTPLESGRTLGGAIWRIQREIDVVIYVSDANHRHERHLRGIVKKLKTPPTLMIMDIASYTIESSPSIKDQDGALAAKVLECLRRGGDVLMPVDSTGRVLELLYALDAIWRNQRAVNTSYDLCFLTRISGVIRVAQSRLEYMTPEMQKALEQNKVNPFELPSVKFVDSIERLPTGVPKVIVCSSASLEGGYAQELFLKEFCKRPDCMILLTEQQLERLPIESDAPISLNKRRTVAAQLWNQVREVECQVEKWIDLNEEELKLWNAKKLEESRARSGRDINVQQDGVLAGTTSKVTVDGVLKDEDGLTGLNTSRIEGELIDSIKQEKEDKMAMNLDTSSSHIITRLDSDLSTSATSTTAAQHHVISVITPEIILRMTGEGLISALTKDYNKIFPFFDPWKGKRWDEYGEIINDADYMDEKDYLELIGNKDKQMDTMMSKGDGFDDEDEEEENDMYGYSSKGGRNNYDNDFDLDDRRNEPPRKRFVELVKVNVQCGVDVVNFGGWAGGMDLVKIVDSFRPKKLVVVRGQPTATHRFLLECKRIDACGISMAPYPGECIDIASRKSVLMLKLAEDLLYSLTRPIQVSSDYTVQKIKGYLFDGVLQSLNSKEDAIDNGDVLWVSQGDPSLTKLQEVLKIEAGIESKFEEGGALVCLPSATYHGPGKSAPVVVFRPAGGQMQVSGPLCDLYFKVREILYSSCFTIV